MTSTLHENRPPAWLLAFWKEIDDKTFAKASDCFVADAICNWAWLTGTDVRLFAESRAFIDTGFPAITMLLRTGTVAPLKVFAGSSR